MSVVGVLSIRLWMLTLTRRTRKERKLDRLDLKARILVADFTLPASHYYLYIGISLMRMDDSQFFQFQVIRTILC